MEKRGGRGRQFLAGRPVQAGFTGTQALTRFFSVSLQSRGIPGRSHFSAFRQRCRQCVSGRQRIIYAYLIAYVSTRARSVVSRCQSRLWKALPTGPSPHAWRRRRIATASPVILSVLSYLRSELRYLDATRRCPGILVCVRADAHPNAAAAHADLYDLRVRTTACVRRTAARRPPLDVGRPQLLASEASSGALPDGKGDLAAG